MTTGREKEIPLVCPVCLAKTGQFILLEIQEGFNYFLCPECGYELHPPVEEWTPRRIFYEELKRPHKRGGGNKSGRKRKKPKKFYRPKILDD